MATKLWAIALMVLCTGFTSTAQIFYKKAANKLVFTIPGILTNLELFIGIGLYAIGAVIMITAFRGGEVSVLYPIVATSYIWVSLLSWIIFDDNLNILRWLGIALIITGITCISSGSKKGAAI